MVKKSHVSKLQRKEVSQFGWNELLGSGVLEYIDVEEEETTMIAMTLNDLKGDKFLAGKFGILIFFLESKKPNASIKTYTHMEIHPSMILGVCASIIPFPDHNQVNYRDFPPELPRYLPRPSR